MEIILKPQNILCSVWLWTWTKQDNHFLLTEELTNRNSLIAQLICRSAKQRILHGCGLSVYLVIFVSTFEVYIASIIFTINLFQATWHDLAFILTRLEHSISNLISHTLRPCSSSSFWLLTDGTAMFPCRMLSMVTSSEWVCLRSSMIMSNGMCGNMACTWCA